MYFLYDFVNLKYIIILYTILLIPKSRLKYNQIKKGYIWVYDSYKLNIYTIFLWYLKINFKSDLFLAKFISKFILDVNFFVYIQVI